MILAIVQARLSSNRLPNKVLRPLCGQPLIFHVFARLMPSRHVDKFILATTTKSSDLPLCQWAEANQIPCFRGEEDDVLNRFYKAAKLHNPKIIVRITADDPFKDYRLMDRMIDVLNNERLDFITNNNPPTYPEGMDIEVMTFDCLKTAYQSAKDPFEKEHVTQYIYRNLSQFKIANLANPDGDLSHLRWTIDTEADLLMAQKVYDTLHKSDTLFQYEEILGLLKNRPEIEKINEKEIRSTMYRTKNR